MGHNPEEILSTILERLKMLASTETVVGQPVKIDNITLLPVIKLTVGFAAGGGEGSSEKESSGSGGGAGGAGGGGASVSPVGFIVLEGDQVRFIGIGKGKIETLVETVPEVLKKFGIHLFKDGKADKKKSRKEKRDPGKEKSGGDRGNDGNHSD